MTITELFTLIENQAEMEAMNELPTDTFFAKFSHFYTKMFCALVYANLSEGQIDSIVSRMKLAKED